MIVFGGTNQNVYVDAPGPWQLAVDRVLEAPAPLADTDRFSLSAGPVPATSMVHITFELPESGAVRLDVFDANGRRVDSPLAGTLAAGRPTIAWSPNAATRPAGLYWVRLTHKGQTATQRMVLLR